MKIGDKVQYIGKGFLSFDKNDTEMIIVSVEKFDFWVLYKGRKILVRDYEVEIR